MHVNQMHGQSQVCPDYRSDTFHSCIQGIPTGHTAAPTTFLPSWQKQSPDLPHHLSSLPTGNWPALPAPACLGGAPSALRTSCQLSTGQAAHAPARCQSHPLLCLPPQHLAWARWGWPLSAGQWWEGKQVLDSRVGGLKEKPR